MKNKYVENYYTELKLEFIEKIKNEIIAFINSDGGVIYVGVNDEGNPIGIETNEKEISK